VRKNENHPEALIVPAQCVPLAKAERSVEEAFADTRPGAVLLCVGTGVGKTAAAVRHLRTTERPTVLLSSRVTLATEAMAAAAEIEGPREQPTRYHPRTPPGLSAAQPGGCPQFESASAVAGRDHVPAAAACSTCPSGDRRAFDIALADNDLDRAAQIDARAAVPLGDVEPCRWIDQLAGVKTADSLVATAASWSTTLGKTAEGIVRDVIIDEPQPPLRWVNTTPADIESWLDTAIRRAAEARESLELERESPLPDPEKISKEQSRLDTLLAVIPILHRILGALPDAEDAIRLGARREPPSPELRAALSELVALAGASSDDHTAAMVGAKWESARLDWAGGHDEIPLRRAGLLTWSLSQPEAAGALWCEGRTIRALSPTPLGAERLRPHPDHRLTTCDATPSLLERRSVIAAGGQVLDAYPAQGASVAWWSGLAFVRGPRSTARRRAPREARRIASIRDEMWRTTGSPRPPVVLSHKVIVEAGRELGLWGEGDSGWWGRDERGTNKWSGRDLLVCGLPIPPRSALADAWTAERAWAIACGVPADELAGELSVGPEGWESGVGVEIGQATWKSIISLPHDRDHRAWLLDRLGIEVAQAIGRVRGVRAMKTPTVWVCGPAVPGLERFGIEVAYQPSRPPGAGATLAETNAARRANAWLRLARGVRALAEDGQWPSYRALARWVRDHNDGPDAVIPDFATWAAFCDRWRGVNPALVLAELEALASACAETAPGEVTLLRVVESCESQHGAGCQTGACASELVQLLLPPPAPQPVRWLAGPALARAG